MLMCAACLPAQSVRRVLPFPLERIGGIGGPANDLLLDPGMVACAGADVLVFDYGDMRLKSFSINGAEQWSVGRAGAGPGEYRNPTDLRTTSEESILLRDPSNARILILNGTGGLRGAIPTASQSHKMLALANNRVMVLGGSHNDFAVIMDDKGRVATTVPLPPTEAARPVVSRQAVAAQASDGVGVIAYVYGGEFIVVDADGEMKRMHGIEPLGFPDVVSVKVGDKKQYTATRVDPKAPRGTRSAAVDKRHVYLAFGGRSKDAGALLDVYDRGSGAYKYSWRIPKGVVSVTACDEALVFHFNDPLPHLILYRTPSKG
jgi:hypothetical protein